MSSYQVKLPIWDGANNIRQPFLNWSKKNDSEKKLSWYQAYNATKHDRHEEFKKANLNNLIDAICGLLVILSSQFYNKEFSSGPLLLALNDGPNDGMESAIGDYFRVRFPSDWPKEDCYDFDWQEIKDEKEPFAAYCYQ